MCATEDGNAGTRGQAEIDRHYQPNYIVTALPFVRMKFHLLFSPPLVFLFLSYHHTLGFEFSESPKFLSKVVLTYQMLNDKHDTSLAKSSRKYPSETERTSVCVYVKNRTSFGQSEMQLINK